MKKCGFKMNLISITDFKKLDLRVAKIISVERVENSDKLLKLKVSLGKQISSSHTITRDSIQSEAAESKESGKEERQIIAGIGKAYVPEELVGKEIVIVANLEPRQLMGLESNGMILCADAEDGPVLLVPEKAVDPGAKVK